MQVLSRLFSGKTDTGSSGVERTDARSFSRKLSDKMLTTVGWRAKTICVARADCHRLTLSVKDVPKRLLASTIRLQLLSLTGLQTFGFAWRTDADNAEIWYWDETPSRFVEEALEDGILPIPEMFWRTPIDDGLHILSCVRGYEALAIDHGKIRRSRWFAGPPNTSDWVAFVRDAGQNPGLHPLPQPTISPKNERLDTTWKIVTTRRASPRPKAWIAVATILVFGVLLSIQLTRDAKYSYLIAQQKEKLDSLRVEKSAILHLQKQIAERSDLPERISKALPRVLQLRLMQALAETGLFDEGTQISLLEWEYRNEKLRLMFSVPKENFSLGLFLSTLEGSGILNDVRLMPETPPQTIGIQATVRELPPSRPISSDTPVGAKATESR